MSRVTIGEITEELLPFTEKGNKVIMVEIVPRKIVEDIIAECEKKINLSNVSFGNDGTLELTRDYYKGVGNCAKDIKSFALHFLDVFETGGE